MIIEIFDIDSPNQEYPLFFSTKDIVCMNATTGEIRFQHGEYSARRKVTTEKFTEILESWRLDGG